MIKSSSHVIKNTLFGGLKSDFRSARSVSIDTPPVSDDNENVNDAAGSGFHSYGRSNDYSRYSWPNDRHRQHTIGYDLYYCCRVAKSCSQL